MILDDLKNKCYFCNSDCNDEFLAVSYIRKTFANYDIIKSPLSKYICSDCAWAFGSKSEIIMNDGEIRIGSPRNYSWLIAGDKKIAYTKAHLKKIRQLILNPPRPPFKIIISDSGQKHLIFRLNYSNIRDKYVLQFEEMQIKINTNELQKRLLLCDKLSAAIGKMALLNCDKISYTITIYNYYENLTDYENWLKIKNEPLSKLAAWLALKKEDAQNEYPTINTGGIQKKNSGVRRSPKKNGRNRNKSNGGRDNQIHFDFARTF